MRKLALLLSAALVVSAPLIVASPTFTYAAAKKKAPARTAAPKETSPQEANSRFLHALSDLTGALQTYVYVPGGDGGARRAPRRKRG